MHVRAHATWLVIGIVGCRPAIEAETVAPVPIFAAPPMVATPEPEPAPIPEPPAPPPAPWEDEDIARIRSVQPLVHAAAREHGVDPNVVNAIIWHESRFNARAKGPGGAAGLMQLMPSTSRSLAKRLGVAHKPYDAKFNVGAGAYLLSRLLKIFDGDLDLALAGYALGHVAVKRRIEAGEPLPERTQRFITKVNDWAAAFAAAPELAPPTRGDASS